MEKTAYKLFRTKNGKLYPLYVLSNKETPMNEWLPAENGVLANDGKHVKSKLGELAYRPGWHLSDIPYASHIGKKGPDGKLYQALDTVWCECEYSADIDYQDEANERGMNPKTGKINAKLAQLNRIPTDGFYRYKTNPNMTGAWIIAGGIKVNRVISNDEVAEICREHGVEPQPLETEMPDKNEQNVA